jgi:hypothetical protein
MGVDSGVRRAVAVSWILLVPRNYRDPRLDFAILYFGAGLPALLVISGVVMIYGQ